MIAIKCLDSKQPTLEKSTIYPIYHFHCFLTSSANHGTPKSDNITRFPYQRTSHQRGISHGARSRPSNAAPPKTLELASVAKGVVPISRSCQDIPRTKFLGMPITSKQSQKTMENHHLQMGKSTRKITIFNSYFDITRGYSSESCGILMDFTEFNHVDLLGSYALTN